MTDWRKETRSETLADVFTDRAGKMDVKGCRDFFNCRKTAAKRHKTGGHGIGYSEETKNRKAGRVMNKQKFCWPRCLLLGIGLVVIGLVTIAVFVPGVGMGRAIRRGAGMLRALLPDALVGGRQPCIYTLSLCRGGFATCSGVKNKKAGCWKAGRESRIARLFA